MIKKLLLVVALVLWATLSHASNDLDKFPKVKSKLVLILEKAGIVDSHAVMSDPKIKLYPEIFKPAKGLPNDGYGLIFTPESIRKGKQFIIDNEELLDAVEQKYGVPKHFVVAITRVETNFGGYMGRLEVLNSLLTWIVHGKWYRKSMFEKELAAWLVICQVNGVLDPFNYVGSICGAFGLVQFMPTSYLRWAVEWNDGEPRTVIYGGKPNLYSIPDAMASCANYLQSNGWGATEVKQRKAVMAYNADRTYTRQVLAYAKEIRTWKTLKEVEPKIIEPVSGE